MSNRSSSDAAADRDFQVLARRYRPQSFPEVVGQETIVRTLINAIEAQRVAHAYLFHGTRGVGKTTMARLLAKALNCEQGPTPEPCNSCSSCTEIAAGTAVDVLEIDGASHNRVDDVRELQDSLTYQPVRDRHRVVIIDEVHMLSRSAFNALLKTLEEPPGHVIFVLATTELDKIPPTILSRCQHFTFRRVRRGALQEHLAAICSREGLEYSETSLAMVARHAAGSVRDALSALDQVVAFCGRKADDADVEAVLGSLPAARVDELLGHIIHGDATAALTALGVSEDRGDDPARFTEALLMRLRDLAVLAATGGDHELVECGEEERRELAALAEEAGPEALLRLLQLAVQMEPALRHSRHPRLVLELTALKMIHAADLTPLAELAARLSGDDAPAVAGRPAPSPSPRRQSPPPAAPRTPSPQTRRTPRPQTEPARQAPATPAVGTSSPPPDADRMDLQPLREDVEGRRPAVAAFLEHAEGALVDGHLHLMFQPRHSFFKKSVEMPANMDALQQSVRQVMGDTVQVHLSLAERDRPEPAPQPEKQADQRRRLMAEAGSQPGVKAMKKVFDAEITHIQPAGSSTKDGPEETHS